MRLRGPVPAHAPGGRLTCFPAGTTILVVWVDAGVKREEQGGEDQLVACPSSLLTVAPGTPGFYTQFLTGQT